jgi:hypothetical protein
MNYLYLASVTTWVSLPPVCIYPFSSFFLKIYSAFFSFSSMASGSTPSAYNLAFSFIFCIIIYRFLSCSTIYGLAFLGGAILAFYINLALLFFLRVIEEIAPCCGFSSGRG